MALTIELFMINKVIGAKKMIKMIMGLMCLSVVACGSAGSSFEATDSGAMSYMHGTKVQYSAPVTCAWWTDKYNQDNVGADITEIPSFFHVPGKNSEQMVKYSFITDKARAVVLSPGESLYNYSSIYVSPANDGSVMVNCPAVGVTDYTWNYVE